jgi:hypothetical protein
MIRASIGCWRAVCGCFEQRRNQASVLTALEQMGREGMAKRLKRKRLASPAASTVSLNSRLNWRVVSG